MIILIKSNEKDIGIAKKSNDSKEHLSEHFFNLSDTVGQFRRKGTAKWRAAKDIRGIPKDS